MNLILVEFIDRMGSDKEINIVVKNQGLCTGTIKREP